MDENGLTGALDSR